MLRKIWESFKNTAKMYFEPISDNNAKVMFEQARGVCYWCKSDLHHGSCSCDGWVRNKGVE